MIVRDIEVLRKIFPQPIEIIIGTNAVPIGLNITDVKIPNGATAEAFVTGKHKNPARQSCTVSGNLIKFTPESGLFEEGKNAVRIAIHADGKKLISFSIPVNCEKTLNHEEAQEVQNGY